MALAMIGGEGFKLLFSAVTLAYSQNTGFKRRLRSLQLKLVSLQWIASVVQRIGEYNLELDLGNNEIEELNRQMVKGTNLVRRLSRIRIWHWNYCIKSCLYSDQLEELESHIKRLLDSLVLRDYVLNLEVLSVLRRNEAQIPDLARTVQGLQRTLDAILEITNRASGTNTEALPNGNGNGPLELQQVPVDGLGTFGPALRMLSDAVTTVKKEGTMFKPVLGDIKSKLDSLHLLMKEMGDRNQLLIPGLEMFTFEIAEGLTFVQKCSNVGLWNSRKKYRYTNKLHELNRILGRLLHVLKFQRIRVGKEAFVSVGNIETANGPIEENTVLQNQSENKIKGSIVSERGSIEGSLSRKESSLERISKEFIHSYLLEDEQQVKDTAGLSYGLDIASMRYATPYKWTVQNYAKLIEAIHRASQDKIGMYGGNFAEWWTDQKHQPLNSRLLSIPTDGVIPTKRPNMQLPKAEVLALSFQATNWVLPNFPKKMDKSTVLIVGADLKNFESLGSLSNLKRIRLEHMSNPSISKKDIQFSMTNCHKLSALPDGIGKQVKLEASRLSSCKELLDSASSARNLKKLNFVQVHI